MQDVEDLAADLLGGRLEGGDHGVGDVADVDERAPHPAAAVQQQLVVEQRVLGEGVDHEVEAHPRAVAVDGAVAQQHGAQPVVDHLQQLLLAVALGGRVGGAGLDVGGLVVHAGGHAVIERAGGGEDVALDAARHAHATQGLGGDGVHLPVGLGVELGGRVVGEPGEVDDAVDAVQRVLGDVAHVGDDQLDLVAEVRQRLLAEVQAVQHPHLVAAHQQPRDQHAADVAGAAGHQDRLARARSLGSQTIAAAHGRKEDRNRSRSLPE